MQKKTGRKLLVSRLNVEDSPAALTEESMQNFPTALRISSPNCSEGREIELSGDLFELIL
jgi:hypothetical protein